MSKQLEITPEYITIAEYCRRKNEMRLLQNPDAPSRLHDTTIYNAIKKGLIGVFVQGTRRYIDWNKYKNVIFPVYGARSKVDI